jgi:hypothetical protein
MNHALNNPALFCKREDDLEAAILSKLVEKESNAKDQKSSERSHLSLSEASQAVPISVPVEPVRFAPSSVRK